MVRIQHDSKERSFVLSSSCKELLTEVLTNTEKSPDPLSDTLALVQNHGTEAETEVKWLGTILRRPGWVASIICLALKPCECV